MSSIIATIRGCDAALIATPASSCLVRTVSSAYASGSATPGTKACRGTARIAVSISPGRSASSSSR
jgi:hypothetical protein